MPSVASAVPAIIYGCKTCTTEGQDTCATCESGFKLNAAGKCESTNTRLEL